MFKEFLETVQIVYKGLGRRVKIGLLVLIAFIIMLIAWRVIVNNLNTAQQVSDSELLSNIRTQIDRLGNPLQIPSESVLKKYPFIVKERVTGSIYLIEVNTSMLRDEQYKGLFEADNNIKLSLQDKPAAYTDTYQMYFDSDTNLSLNPFARMTNFNKIKLEGEEKYFSEENQDYWYSNPVADSNTSNNGLKKIKRSSTLIKPFNKLTKIDNNKFFATNKDELSLELQYVIMEVFSNGVARFNSGSLNYIFLDPPINPNDGEFTGAIAASEVIPTAYPITDKLILQKSINNTEAIFTIADITNIETPKLLSDKQFSVKEFNSIFVTCSPIKKKKCWIINPGIKKAIEIDEKGNKTEKDLSKEIDLIALKESYKLTLDKEQIVRYNEDSDEVLIFYQGNWKSILRF
jgi:hypothetical protein